MQISRQKLSKDWHRKLQAIKAKAAEAAEELPPPLALPEKNLVEYAAVKSIRDKLAETADKTFFGIRTGPAGLWDKILRAYEKDSTPPASCLPLFLFAFLPYPSMNAPANSAMVIRTLRPGALTDNFLGEAGQLLVRNIDFEIPYLKQQAAKEQQQLADLERKHTEHLHSAMQAARHYQQVSDKAHMPLSDMSGPRCVCRFRGCMFLWGLLALMCAQSYQGSRSV